MNAIPTNCPPANDSRSAPLKQTWKTRAADVVRRGFGRLSVALNGLVGSRVTGRFGILMYHRIVSRVPGCPAPFYCVDPAHFCSSAPRPARAAIPVLASAPDPRGGKPKGTASAPRRCRDIRRRLRKHLHTGVARAQAARDSRDNLSRDGLSRFGRTLSFRPLGRGLSGPRASGNVPSIANCRMSRNGRKRPDRDRLAHAHAPGFSRPG